MRLTLDNQSTVLRVSRYGPGEVWIGAQCLQHSFILSARQLRADWNAHEVATLSRLDLQPLLDLRPRIILLGSSVTAKRLPAPVRLAIESLGIAIECMDVGAACRTYNVLSQEDREVVAGFVLP
jgi:uncharacterized protein